jgi:hypothetical protein
MVSLVPVVWVNFLSPSDSESSLLDILLDIEALPAAKHGEVFPQPFDAEPIVCDSRNGTLRSFSARNHISTKLRRPHTTQTTQFLAR